MPPRCCPDLDACRKHMQKSDALFEYWRGAFGIEVPAVNFNGRGWGVEPEKKTHHKGGVKAASRGEVKLTRDNIVLNLSSHTYVDTFRNVNTLRCACNPEKVGNRGHRRQKCECLPKMRVFGELHR
ncbi:unnamed protein product [Sphacelaria rigidula]